MEFVPMRARGVITANLVYQPNKAPAQKKENISDKKESDKELKEKK